jgi:aryl sulfotransferase
LPAAQITSICVPKALQSILASVIQNYPHVHLFHYSDLLADLPGQLRRLADALSIDVTDERVEQVAAATTFERMKQRADELVPEVGNHIWRNNQGFFHRGCDGQWRELLDDEGLRRYERRVAEVATPDAAAWAHTGWLRLDAASENDRLPLPEPRTTPAATQHR